MEDYMILQGIDTYKESINRLQNDDRPSIYWDSFLSPIVISPIVIENLKIDSDFLCEVFDKEKGTYIDLEIGEWLLKKTAKGNKVLWMWTHVFGVVLIATKYLDDIEDEPSANDIVKVLNKYVENGEELPIQVRV